MSIDGIDRDPIRLFPPFGGVALSGRLPPILSLLRVFSPFYGARRATRCRRGAILTGGRSGEKWTGSLQSLVHRYGYGCILVVSLLVLWWGVKGAYPLENVANGLYVVVLLIILGLEVWIPYTRSWGDIRTVTRADVIYFLLAAPIDALQMFLLITLLAETAQYHHFVQVVDIWPNDAHVLLQLFLVILIVDFFKYWYHRWTHEIHLLWRIHSIHHCLDRLEMLRASYFYPIDIFLTVATGTFAMLMFGVGYEVIIFHNLKQLLNVCREAIACFREA